MAGVEGQGPFLPAALYQVSCCLLGCRLANMQPGSRPYAWPCFCRISLEGERGRGGGGGSDAQTQWPCYSPANPPSVAVLQPPRPPLTAQP